MSDLNCAVGKDVTDEDRAINFVDDYKTAVDAASFAADSSRNLLSKFDSTGSTVALLDSEAVLTPTCVVLSAASNLVSLRLPDVTLYKIQASLDRVEGKLDQILAAPLKKASDYFRTVMNAVATKNFKLAYEKLPLLIENATTAFHYADKKEIGIESFRLYFDQK